jgi:general nucleoside transport system permease protein
MATADTRPRLRWEVLPFGTALLKWAGWTALAFGIFALLLLLYGKDPLQAYARIISSTLGSTYGISEVIVKMIPLVILALAVAIPARIGLINVGGEGQLLMGGLFASWGALTFTTLPAWLLLPFMVLLGFIGGGLWAGIAAVLRAKGWLLEVFSTLLMNYIAILLVEVVVFGPWRDPSSGNYPQTRLFPAAGWLPTIGGTRIHLGLVIAAVALLLFQFLLWKTRWGLEMRAIGGNAEAARRNGIPIGRYIVVVLVIAGGVAGMAGMAEVSAIQHRLNPGLSTGYGYVAFLVSWLAGHRPWAIVAMAFLLAVLVSGGDILQITQSLPYAAVNILIALILVVVLAGRAQKKVAQ